MRHQFDGGEFRVFRWHDHAKRLTRGSSKTSLMA